MNGWLVQDRRLTAADSASILSEHVNSLADSITQFAVTNSALRCMLHDRRDHELNALRLYQQRDTLLSKLAHTQDSCQVPPALFLVLFHYIGSAPVFHYSVCSANVSG